MAKTTKKVTTPSVETMNAKYMAKCEETINGYNLATRKKTAQYVVENSVLYSSNEVNMAKAILRAS